MSSSINSSKSTQHKVLAFLVITVVLLGSSIYLNYKRIPSEGELSQQLEKILEADRMNIEEKLQEAEEIDLSGDDLRALGRLSQARDKILIDSAVKWRKSTNPIAIEIVIGGLGPYLFIDDQVEKLLRDFYGSSRGSQRQRVLESILSEKTERRLGMASELLMKWPNKERDSVSYLRSVLNYLEQGGKDPKQQFANSLKESFRECLSSGKLSSGRMRADGLRQLIEGFLDHGGKLNGKDKSLLQKVLESIPYDPKLEGDTVKRIKSLIS